MSYFTPRFGFVRTCLATVFGGFLWASTSAQAGLPDCPRATPPVTILKNAGILESMTFDREGRLLFTDVTKASLNTISQPGVAPKTLATGIRYPGGIALGEGSEVFVGTGNDLAGLTPAAGKAGILRVNMDTGVVTPHIKGLAMANGIVRTATGEFYASDTLGPSLDRVLANGVVQRTWLRQNANGIALSPDGRTLYMNQSFPAKILAVDLATGSIRTHATPPLAQALSYLDGMTIDANGTLYVAAYVAGQVWRVGQDRSICVLAKGMPLASAVAIGRPERGFSPTSLYVSTHGGRIFELPGAIEPGAAPTH